MEHTTFFGDACESTPSWSALRIQTWCAVLAGEQMTSLRFVLPGTAHPLPSDATEQVPYPCHYRCTALSAKKYQNTQISTNEKSGTMPHAYYWVHRPSQPLQSISFWNRSFGSERMMHANSSQIYTWSAENETTKVHAGSQVQQTYAGQGRCFLQNLNRRRHCKPSRHFVIFSTYY